MTNPVFLRNLTRACLIIPDMSYAEISNELGITVETMTACEQLFWNVRDRRVDSAYLLALVFPPGKAMWTIRGMDFTQDSGQSLLQVAHLLGRDALFYWAGLRRDSETQFDPQEAAQELQMALLRNADTLAKCGLLNQDLPAMKDAVQMLNRTRSEENDPAPATDGMTFGQSILSTLRKIQGGNSATDQRP